MNSQLAAPGNCALTTVLCLVVSGLSLVGQVNAQCQYEVTIIQAPECPWPFGFPPTTGTGLNELGHVVGFYSHCGGEPGDEAFIWTPESGLVTLPRPPGVWSSTASDLNDADAIAGTYRVTGVGDRGYVYQDGLFTELPPVMNITGPRSSAAAINNDGIVVGKRSLGKEYVPYSAYLWSADTGFTDLGDEYGPYSLAAGMNEAGQVAISIGPALGDQAYVWDGQNLSPIGVIPGGFSSKPSGINASGQVACVGAIEDKNGKGGLGFLARSFLWDGGKTTLLGVLPAYAHTTAHDLSDLGVVVGSCTSGDNPNDRRAFLWQAGDIFDLNDLVPPDLDIFIGRAEAINKAGQVVADGSANGDIVTFLLTPSKTPLGDLNGDCSVGIIDLLTLLARWGVCPDCENCSADVDGDCAVGILDLLVLLANWG